MLGQQSPNNATEGHAAGKHHLIGAQGAGLYPVRRGDLDGEVERGHRAGPGKAGHQQNRNDDQRIADEGQNQQRSDEYAGRGGYDLVGGEFAPNMWGRLVAPITAPRPMLPLRIP